MDHKPGHLYVWAHPVRQLCSGWLGGGEGAHRSPMLLSVSAIHHTCGLQSYSVQNCLWTLIAAMQLHKL